MGYRIFRPYHTETAGTAITEIIPAIGDWTPVVERLVYENAGTEHTLTVMKTIASALVTSQAAASGTTIEVEKLDFLDGENLVANDWVAWYDENKDLNVDSIASSSGSTLTLNNTIPADIPIGNRVWAFYEVGRADHHQLKLPISVTTTIEGNLMGGKHVQGGAAANDDGKSDPILIHIDNITAAGKLMYLSGQYTTDILKT